MAALPRTIDRYGRVVLTPETMFEHLYQGGITSGLYVEDGPELKAYNERLRHHDKADHLMEAPECLDDDPETVHAFRSRQWMIPSEYRAIDVRYWLASRCSDDMALKRTNMEMDMFEERGLTQMLQTMIYLVDQWRAHNIIWGVGRGSSVASYCLFLIGVHRINPLKYDLDIGEFLK
jgi:DNA polymerase III alpha subunit